jgi:hypothetical protein
MGKKDVLIESKNRELNRNLDRLKTVSEMLDRKD